MDDYFLTKEQWDAIVDLGVGADYRAVTILAKIPTATKSAFTRKCVVVAFSRNQVLSLNVCLGPAIATTRSHIPFPFALPTMAK